MRTMCFLVASLLLVLSPITAASAELSFSDRLQLLSRAKAAQDAMLAQNVEALVDLTDESVYLLGLTRQTLADVTRSAFAQSNAIGLRLERSELGEPTQTYEANGRTVCFVPYTLFVRMGAKSGRSIGYVVAIRDGSSDWKFLDSAMLRSRPGALRLLVPGLPEGVSLPRNENVFDQ